MNPEVNMYVIGMFGMMGMLGTIGLVLVAGFVFGGRWSVLFKLGKMVVKARHERTAGGNEPRSES